MQAKVPDRAGPGTGFSPGRRPRSAGRLVLLSAFVLGLAAAEPFVPDSDQYVVARLPATLRSAEERAGREQRAALRASPTNLALAVPLAWRLLGRARTEADPRHLSYAQAALAPWWDLAEPPVDVRLVRGTVRQSLHDFAGATADFTAAARLAPQRVEPWLQLAAVQLVRGEYAAARPTLAALLTRADELTTATAAATLASLTGDAARAQSALAAALARNPTAPESVRLWALTQLAETAARLGRSAEAETRFRAALESAPRDAYLLGAWGDFLLDQSRAAEVPAALRDRETVDGLRLRLAEAEQALGRAEAVAAHVAVLEAGFAAARRRGETVHQREEARLELRLRQRPARALELARANWHVQREPADLRLLLETAAAAGDAPALALGQDWLRQHRLEDVALDRFRPAVNFRRRRRLWSTALLWLASAVLTLAHHPSDAFLRLERRGHQLAGQWEIAVRDLEEAVGVDADGDGAVTWGELRARHAALAAYALGRLELRAGELPLEPVVTEHLVSERTDGAYAVLRFTAPWPAGAAQLAVTYRLFADVDPLHRGLVAWRAAAGESLAVLGPGQPTARFAPDRPGNLTGTFFREGVWHIWIGFDHLLFLLALLLPAVLRRTPAGWEPEPRLGVAFTHVAQVVTAFTAAHSLTLLVATLGWVSLPARLVESVIAASVVLAALNNVWRLFPSRSWPVAFGFGLMHGFGFAGVLRDLGLAGGAVVKPLLAFNLGVEAGQLAAVLAVLPLLFLLRARPGYRAALLPAGSVAIALVAAAWLVERACAVTLPWS
jgi:Tfp pilus assembly protein PilF